MLVEETYAVVEKGQHSACVKRKTPQQDRGCENRQGYAAAASGSGTQGSLDHMLGPKRLTAGHVPIRAMISGNRRRISIQRPLMRWLQLPVIR